MALSVSSSRRAPRPPSPAAALPSSPSPPPPPSSPPAAVAAATAAVVASPLPSPRPSEDDGGVFLCHEESALYSRGVERLLKRRIGDRPLSALELGPGDGVPVLRALSRLAQPTAATAAARVVAYEVCPVAAAAARRNIIAARLPPGLKYEIIEGDFFEAAGPSSSSSLSSSSAAASRLLIANPPYLPAPSREGLLLPGLWGGRDGADVTRRLLLLEPPCQCDAALLLLAGVASPRSVLLAARRSGFRVRAFEATRLPFGAYTSQPSVRSWIAALERDGLAHTLEEEEGGGGGGYVCAAVEFERSGSGGGWVEARLEAALTERRAWADSEVVLVEEEDEEEANAAERD